MTYPKDIQVNVDSANYWKGLGRQEMNFHQVLGELIDNAISATGIDEDGERNPFKVEVSIEKIGEKLNLTVADHGLGMDEEEIIDEIFSLGGRGKSKGILNEHGFGLKNALAILTEGDSKKWAIYSRTEKAAEKDIVYKVEGPFVDGLKLNITDENEWKELSTRKVKSGTVIKVETSLSYFGTVYNRGRVFPTLLARLLEHLGVMYRGFLRNKYNKLWFRWKETSSEESDSSEEWKEVRVKPIEIKYDDEGYRSLTINIPGDLTVQAQVNVGRLDVYETTILGCPTEYENCGISPYPLKIYYQSNQTTQGVDIVVRGRVIKTAQFTEIWDIERHNDYNKFVGEVLLEDKHFKTVNNKTGLDPNNPYTVSLYESLKNPLEEEDKIGLKPDKITNTNNEKDAKKKIKKILENNYSGSEAELERAIFGGVGVKVDVCHWIKKGKEDERIEIYEVKRDSAAPLNAYQLLMYWDGIVKDENKSPALGRLVAKKIPPSVRNILEDMNKRKDNLGNNYNLEWKELKPFIGEGN